VVKVYRAAPANVEGAAIFWVGLGSIRLALAGQFFGRGIIEERCGALVLGLNLDLDLGVPCDGMDRVWSLATDGRGMVTVPSLVWSRWLLMYRASKIDGYV
jgi:hypothetical protein